jgi:hypothetical protein
VVDRVARAAGFSLHAGIAAWADQRKKVERLCRYIARPSVAAPRLSLTDRGEVRYTLKTPYSDGITHVVFQPLDLMARLAALVPRPRVNVTRFHGVLAPDAKWRGGGVGAAGDATGPASRQAMTWAQRLKRVSRIEIERCGRYGGQMREQAAIEDRAIRRRHRGLLAGHAQRPDHGGAGER